MAWALGRIGRGCVYFHRTPRTRGRPPIVRVECSRDEAGAILDYIEMNGREPLTTEEVRMLLGPDALKGES